MRSWYAIRARAGGAEIAIYDEIGAYGVSAKGFLADLGGLPDGTPIDLRLNSPGGSVFDAVAIHNALKRHAGPVTVWIDGIAASAASYVAMAGDEIVIPENAFLMIHDPAGLVMGTAEDMRAMAEALDKVKSSLLAGYAAKSGRAAEEIAVLMAAETWLDAKDALELGLADRLAEPVRIAAAFDIGRFRNAPPTLVEAVEAEPAAVEADHTDATGSATENASETSGNGEGGLAEADGEAGREDAAEEAAASEDAPAGRASCCISGHGRHHRRAGPPMHPGAFSPADRSARSRRTSRCHHREGWGIVLPPGASASIGRLDDPPFIRAMP
jgi:ATP-dependent Clp protease, protease subunit